LTFYDVANLLVAQSPGLFFVVGFVSGLVSGFVSIAAFFAAFGGRFARTDGACRSGREACLRG